MWFIADWIDSLFGKKDPIKKCGTCIYANVKELTCQLSIDTKRQRGGFFCMREDREDWEKGLEPDLKEELKSFLSKFK